MVGRIFSGGWSKSSRSLYPEKSCHFCNLSSIIVPPHPKDELKQEQTSFSQSISTGTESNWFCSRCQCWNRYDENEEGGMKSWESRMADESTNNVLYTNTTSSPINRKSIFCHACQTNQTLILSMISNYEEEEEEDTKVSQNQERFKRWRDDLEKRYPPICLDCRDEVQNQLRKADQHARALIWNNLLQNQHTRKSSLPFSNANPSLGAQPSEPIRDLRNVNARTRIDWIWYIGAFFFMSAWMSEVARLACDPIISLPIRISSIAMQSLLVIWDPSLPQQVKFTASNPGTIQLKVEGLAMWQTMQRIIVAIRILHSFQLYLSHKNQFCVSTVFVLVQAILCFLGYRAIKIHLPPRVSLKSKNLTRSLQVQRGGPDLMHLSLQDERPTDQQQELRSKKDDGEEEEEVDDSMDWSPTLPIQNQSKNNTPSYTFGPRRFFEPVSDTGLEDLLRRNLGLQDDSDRDGRMPMDLDLPTNEAQKLPRRQFLRICLAIAFPILVLLFALFLQKQKVQGKENAYILIPKDFYPSTLFRFFQSSFLQPIQQWWSFAFARARQRTDHQALWRPSFEEIANMEENCF